MAHKESQGLPKSSCFHRNLGMKLCAVAKGKGNWLYAEDGRVIMDASGGAAVASIGYGNARVLEAKKAQDSKISYLTSTSFTNQPAEELCRVLCESTEGVMQRALVVCEGSTAMDSALKMARQYFSREIEPRQPERVRFIARWQSYHGNTLGSLAVGGFEARREPYLPLLSEKNSRVSPCYEYRGKAAGETRQDYVARLVQELDDEFQRVGPETVVAFIAEPVVGAALGCVPALAGYFQGVKAVCDKYGALLIFDEIMCGMGRTGTVHAWQHPDVGVAPDIQTIAKGLGGGYATIAAVLVNKRVAEAFEKGSRQFIHGHTYQFSPSNCAAALEVQRIMREENIIANVVARGRQLEKLLRERIAPHPNVGDVRGRGLFWGVEFVADKETKMPFPATNHVGTAICELGLTDKYRIHFYPGSGSAGHQLGDHLHIAPALNITEGDTELIVERLARLVEDFFAGTQFLKLDKARL